MPRRTSSRRTLDVHLDTEHGKSGTVSRRERNRPAIKISFFQVHGRWIAAQYARNPPATKMVPALRGRLAGVHRPVTFKTNGLPECGVPGWGTPLLPFQPGTVNASHSPHTGKTARDKEQRSGLLWVPLGRRRPGRDDRPSQSTSGDLPASTSTASRRPAKPSRAVDKSPLARTARARPGGLLRTVRRSNPPAAKMFPALRGRLAGSPQAGNF